MHRGKEKRNLDPLKKSDSAGQEEEEEEEKGLKKRKEEWDKYEESKEM